MESEVCETCDGAGSIEDFYPENVCCERPDMEGACCMVPEVEWVSEMVDCPECGGPYGTL